MKDFFGRAAMPLRLCISICALGAMLFVTTGCSVLGAMANPKVAWAIRDPAPMTVVVRRADAAENTAHQVDRLLTSTPAAPDAPWLGPQWSPSRRTRQVELKAREDRTDVRAVASARRERRGMGPHAPRHHEAPTEAHRTFWPSSRPTWPPTYAAIVAKQDEIAKVREQIATEKAARDAKGVSDADKAAHNKTIDEMDKNVSEDGGRGRADAEEVPRRRPRKPPTGTVQRLATPWRSALVNLKQAVEDASISNSAAAVRYPLAVTSMLDSVKMMVPIFVADIISEGADGRFRPHLEHVQARRVARRPEREAHAQRPDPEPAREAEHRRSGDADHRSDAKVDRSRGELAGHRGVHEGATRLRGRCARRALGRVPLQRLDEHRRGRASGLERPQGRKR